MNLDNHDFRAAIVAHPITGMLHASHIPNRPRCNDRTNKMHKMVNLQKVTAAHASMFCERCFGDAETVRTNAANGEYRLAI